MTTQTATDTESPREGDVQDAACDDQAPPGTTDGVEHRPARGGRIKRILVFLGLPTVILMLACAAGYTKWIQEHHHVLDTARSESVAAAKEITVTMLSYTPETAEATLGAARERMTGALRDTYGSLISKVVIPGAQQKHISATATVAATASISANDNRAVVLVFVDQSITQGQDAPVGTASTVRVTMERVGTRWLASGFEPI